ncbi:GLPGLI family protein [Hymenobacter agri]
MNPGKLAFYFTFITFSALFRLDAIAQPALTTQSTACLRAIYQLDYKPDSAVNTPKRVQMILRISSGISRFESTGKYILDSVYTSLKGVPEMERLKRALDAPQQAAKNELRYTILKKPGANWVSYHDVIGLEDYQYQEASSLFAWRIGPGKKIIAGHNCQQAYTTFGGRMWEGWFARDIPVSDGPYKFYGLPGLILQVRDTHDNYVFTLLNVDLNPSSFDVTTELEAPFSAKSSAPIISKSKFEQSKRNDELTLLNRMAANGNKVPESAQQNYLAKLKRRNNPLELKQ